MKKRDENEDEKSVFFTSMVNDEEKPHEDFELKQEETVVTTLFHEDFGMYELVYLPLR